MKCFSSVDIPYQNIWGHGERNQADSQNVWIESPGGQMLASTKKTYHSWEA